MECVSCTTVPGTSAWPARGGAASAQTPQGVYLFGGAARDGQHFNDVLRVQSDFAGDLQGSVLAMPADSVCMPCLAGHSAVWCPSLQVVVLWGGLHHGSGEVYDQLWLWHPAENVFRQAATVGTEGQQPHGRAGHSFVSVGGVMWMFAGSSPEHGPSNELWRLTPPDTLEGTWTWEAVGTTGPAPEPREMHNAWAGSGEHAHMMMVWGGRDEDGNPQPTLHALDTRTMTWQAGADCGFARLGASVVAGPWGALVLGGIDTEEGLASSVRWLPTPHEPGCHVVDMPSAVVPRFAATACTLTDVDDAVQVVYAGGVSPETDLKEVQVLHFSRHR